LSVSTVGREQGCHKEESVASFHECQLPHVNYRDAFYLHLAAHKAKTDASNPL
jgi:hypothetical protein